MIWYDIPTDSVHLSLDKSTWMYPPAILLGEAGLTLVPHWRAGEAAAINEDDVVLSNSGSIVFVTWIADELNSSSWLQV